MNKKTIMPILLLAIVQVLFIYTFFVLPVRTFLVSPIKTTGACMFPTMPTSSIVLLNKTAFWFSSPKRGDIVSFIVPGIEEGFMKRVIGLPGETIEIHDNYVFIDGKELKEPYVFSLTFGEYGPVTIPEKCVFVMGDNRGNSIDSRDDSVGMVPINRINGKALCYIRSFKKIKLLAHTEAKLYND